MILPFCPCLDGFYEEDDISVCKNCSFKCKTCLVESVCQTCALNSFRDQLKNCNCQDGYFETGQISCGKCNLKCGVCLN
jgi:hypothetical protein